MGVDVCTCFVCCVDGIIFTYVCTKPFQISTQRLLMSELLTHPTGAQQYGSTLSVVKGYIPTQHRIGISLPTPEEGKPNNEKNPTDEPDPERSIDRTTL